MLATGIREAYAELFSINIRANELGSEDIKNKLRTLFAEKKTALVIGNIAKTFKALCEYADFSGNTSQPSPADVPVGSGGSGPPRPESEESPLTANPETQRHRVPGKISVAGLQYHINIALPDSRDQAVYDAIFRSLREHLG